MFIKTIAKQSNAQGNTDPQMGTVQLELNLDLVGAFDGSSILLKGGNVINLGGKYYTAFQLVQGEKIPKQS